MESLYLLIPVSVLLVLAIGVVFWRAVKSGQMDDLEGPGYRILMDDDLPREDEKSATMQDRRSGEEAARDI